MRIESEKILLASSFDPRQLPNLRDDQLQMLALMQQSSSILQIVEYFFSKGQLVSFLSLLELIKYLLSKKYIVNDSFYDYFQGFFKLKAETGFFDRLAERIIEAQQEKKIDKSKIKSIPFFRSLNADLLEIFLQNSSVVEVPAGITFCQEGAKQRSMLVLLGGEASVYKKNAKGEQSKLIVLSEGSLFGEVGFFFGQERSATVVADKTCHVLVIKYIPEIYDNLIKTDKAKQLQSRIWTIHALLKAEMFKTLPQECFDSLIFAGELKTFPAKTMLCRQSDPGETCYVIIQGKVSINKNLKFIRHLEQGDCFGEMALLVSGGRRTASVHSETEGVVLEIHRNNFYKILSENLLLACEFEKLALERAAANR